jgi:type IV secretory pathway VirB10-like protein
MILWACSMDSVYCNFSVAARKPRIYIPRGITAHTLTYTHTLTHTHTHTHTHTTYPEMAKHGKEKSKESEDRKKTKKTKEHKHDKVKDKKDKKDRKDKKEKKGKKEKKDKKDKRDKHDSKHESKHERKGTSASQGTSAAKMDAGTFISEDDYFLKNEEFRVWCKLIRNK